jgi:chromatin remodeling complex protein RSC6
MAINKINSKTTPASSSTAPAPAPAPAPAAKPVAKPVTEAPAPAPATTATTATATATTPEVDEIGSKFASLSEALVTVSTAVKDMQALLKTLQKEVAKTAKAASKKTRKTPSAAKRTPSGFAKPTALSKELTDFLKVTAGTQLARTEVTRMLNTYIKEHNLQDASDKRKIKPDAALAKLMKLTDKDVLTYFNLQSHIKHHFVKTAA